MNPYKPLIEKVKKLVPYYSEILNPGVSDAEINAFVQEIGVEVPGSFLEFYRVCNGAQPYTTVDLSGINFLPLERIPRSKKMFDEILDEKRAEQEYFHWHKGWLPFADNWSYDTLAIDITGVTTGHKGCVLNRAKDNFEGDPISILAYDFDSFIKGWVKRVEDEQVYSFSQKDENGNNSFVSEYSYDYLEHVPFTAYGA